MENIRNFCTIAHIDHGKSTLADRLLESTKTISGRDMQEQLLDTMDLERERGITIKSHAIQMNYELDGQEYILNLIDTPGHVDFSYEVSRSIAACEGALLIVDSSQGIEAQTISNLYLALDHDLEIIPVLNKIDLPGAHPDEVTDQIVDLLGCDPTEIIRASGKMGIGIDEILQAIIQKIPAPKGNTSAPLQAMIFDSVFNSYRGIEVYFRVFNGTIKKGDAVKFVNTGRIYEAEEIGILKLKQEPKTKIGAGNVGYLISGIKIASEVKVGDTITHVANPSESIKGFEDLTPVRASKDLKMLNPWFLPVYIQWKPAITRNSGHQWKNFSLTMLPWFGNPRLLWHWDLDFDVASLECYIWILFRKGWKGNST